MALAEKYRLALHIVLCYPTLLCRDLTRAPNSQPSLPKGCQWQSCSTANTSAGHIAHLGTLLKTQKPRPVHTLAMPQKAQVFL